ncbi:MAG: hypothetical protein KDK55_02645 [Chlamydiia bacterium]|nr:hypothetical protein [Chlamydiia bacterium]
MTTNSYTEDEFKKVLKTLLDEKKKVIQLQDKLKELEGTSSLKEKFEEKLVRLQTLKVEEKDQEIALLKEQLGKVKPAIAKLVEELKKAKEESVIHKQVEVLPNEKINELKREVDELKKVREGDFKRLSDLEKALEEKKEELKKNVSQFETERQRLVDRLAKTLSQVQRQSDMLGDFREETAGLRKEIELGAEQKQRYEDQLQELKAKLSQSALESTRIHTSIEKELEKEIQSRGKIEISLDAMKQELMRKGEEIRHKEKEIVGLQTALSATEEKLAIVSEQLQETDIAKIQQECEEAIKRVNETHEEKLRLALSAKEEEFEILIRNECQKREEKTAHLFREQEREHENETARLQGEMRDFAEKLASSHKVAETFKEELQKRGIEIEKKQQELDALAINLKNIRLSEEEKETEIKKAQQHLAKKIKEATLLRDMVERQKMQLGQFQSNAANHKAEIERMQNSLNLQRMHEEKIQIMAKDRTQAAEALVKEWQEKYFLLQQEWQSAKAQLLEFQKMKKNYEQMTTAFNSLKGFLNKTFGPQPIEASPSYEEECDESKENLHWS